MSSPLEVPVGPKATSTPTPSAEDISNSYSLSTDSLTHKQQIKQDALGLAEVIYDIFKDSLSSDTMEKIGENDVK